MGPLARESRPRAERSQALAMKPAGVPLASSTAGCHSGPPQSDMTLRKDSIIMKVMSTDESTKGPGATRS